MTEICSVCGKKMSPEDPVMPSRFSVCAYYPKNDGSGEMSGDIPGGENTIVCSKECMLRLMEHRAKQLPKRQTVRICLLLSTTEAPEVLESFARQLRSIRE